MKFFSITILVLMISTTVFSLKLFNLFEEQPPNADPDEMIYKIKSFLDVYSKHLQMRRYLHVSKVLLPSNGNTSKEGNNTDSEGLNAEYIRNLNLDEQKQEIENFLDFIKKIQDKDLKSKRDERQSLEEKSIDFSTKNKILTSRINLANNEAAKAKSDLKKKNDTYSQLNSDTVELYVNRLSELNQTLWNLRESSGLLKELDKVITSFNPSPESKQTEVEVRKRLQISKEKQFEIDRKIEEIIGKNSTYVNFIRKSLELSTMFQNKSSEFKEKVYNITESIERKKKRLSEIKTNIKANYATFDKNNKTFSKLLDMHKNYKKLLRGMEDNNLVLRGKKRIIMENIDEKKKQIKIKEKTIDNILNDLELKLSSFDVNKMKKSYYRRSIFDIKSNIKDLIKKENLIFDSNKIFLEEN